MKKSFSTHIKKHTGLYFILGAALIIRAVYLYLYNQLPEWDMLTVDNYYHKNWAEVILSGDIFGGTTYFRAPFYIYCLAVVYKLFGISIWAARIFGTVIGLSSIAMTYFITDKIADRKTSLLAALIHSCYPMIIYFETELLLDPLFMLLLQISIYFFLNWWDSDKSKHLWWSAIVLGLSAITRPTSLVLIPLMAIVIYLIKRNRCIKQIIILAVGLSIVIMPIFLRNIIVADDPVLISSQGGINFYIGNNETADGVSAVMTEPLGFNWRYSEIKHLAESDVGYEFKPGELSSYWYGRSFDWIIENPGDFFNLYINKLYHNISNREISNNRNLSLFFSQIFILKHNPLSFGILFALIALSFLIAFPDKKILFIISLIIVYTLASALFFFSSRFRLPILPLYIVIGSVGLHSISKLMVTDFKKSILPIIGAILFGLVCYLPLVDLPKGNMITANISQGLYYQANKDFDNAYSYFMSARESDSTYPDVNLNLGALFLENGIEDSALYYLNQEITHNPNRAKSYINLASIASLNGDNDEALAQLSKGLEIRPFDLNANRLWLRVHIKKYANSESFILDEFRKSYLQTDSSIYLALDAAESFLRIGRMEPADSILQNAVASSPPPVETDDYTFERNYINSHANWIRQKAKAYYKLSFIAGVQGVYSRTIDNCLRAIELDPKLSEAYLNLIAAYHIVGQEDNARMILSKALELFPDNQSFPRIQNDLNL